MTNKNDKYFASLFLAIIGDKIGFGNRLRETNYTGEMISIDRPDLKAQIIGLSNMMIYKLL